MIYSRAIIYIGRKVHLQVPISTLGQDIRKHGGRQHLLGCQVQSLVSIGFSLYVLCDALYCLVLNNSDSRNLTISLGW